MTIEDILAAASVASYPAAFRKALALVLQWECEYAPDHKTIRWENDPDDPGGATFAGLLKRDGEVTDASTAGDIAFCYFSNYWMAFTGLPSPVQSVCFVSGVNIGIHPAIRALQFALNDYSARLTIDGSLGDVTRSAAMSVPDSTGLAMSFLQKVRRHYEGIVEKRPSQGKFLNGWLNRLDASKSLLA
jgi:lysozyme family protein